ncbi:MAG: ferric reductase-like transmembrane domain-containing protein [Candidatus Veblenbacteria bacterium]|nr:ferric reductase-like transmembrane domain-containing protein [Candidatus Veblenbacteria bacterium]
MQNTPNNSQPQVLSESSLERIQQHSAAYWHERMYEYGVALGLAIVQFVAFSVYLYGRRGFYDLFIINKAFAGVAAVLLGIVLLLGPLGRMFNMFDKYLRFRKELGIMAFFFALMHTVSSLFFLPGRFPLERYFTTGKWPFLFGLIGIVVLMAIFAISNNRAIQRMTAHRWWFWQRWGIRIALAAVALHVGIMKVPGWIEWYRQGGSTQLVRPEWPGLGILIAWFMIVVIVVRIAEAINIKVGKIVWYSCVFFLPVIYLATFIWGRQFIK